MKLLRLLTILFCVTAFGLLSGCSLTPEKPVYVGPGYIVEVARAAKVKAWVNNKDTGKRELRTVQVLPGWYIGRLKDGE